MMLISLPSASWLALEVRECLLESRGGGNDLFTVAFGGLEDSIQYLYLVVQVGIRFFQFPSDLLQAGLLIGSKRGQKVLVGITSAVKGLIQGDCVTGQFRRNGDSLQQVPKDL